MADAAVRVDIISGQNTVIKSVELTQSKLLGLTGVASRTNTGFENLSKGGLKRLESGFQALAFQAAGVPGPLGRIASGALLLGGGTGVLLGAAVAAGTLGAAWNYLTKQSDDVTAALGRMQKAGKKTTQDMMDLATGYKEIARLQGNIASPDIRARFLFWITGVTAAWREQITVMEEAIRLQETFSAHGATDDWLTNFWKTHPMPKAGKKAAPVRQPDPAQDWWLNQEFTQQSVVRDLKEQMAGLNAELINTPGLLDQIGVALEALVVPFDEIAQAWAEFTQQLRYALFDGMVTLAQGLGQVLAGEGNFGKVILQAFGSLLTQMGVALMGFGATMIKLLPALSNPFTSGPAALIAGAALVAIGATLSAIASKQGSGPSAKAATGGVNSGNLRQDASESAARGTVTVTMGRDGFIRPSDPVFQEFLAQVIKEAKGRNVVFA